MYWKRNEVTDEEWKKYRSQAAKNERSPRGEIAGLFRPDRFTIDHVAPILTGYFISYLYSPTNDDKGFAIGTRCHRAVSFSVTGGTGHGLGFGYC